MIIIIVIIIIMEVIINFSSLFQRDPEELIGSH